MITLNTNTNNYNVVEESDINNYCPIIEDTRTSAVANITGIAPFASLVDKQRIILDLAYNTVASTTLQLTLSDGTTTNAIPVYGAKAGNYGGYQISASQFGQYTYHHLIYDSTNNRWWVVGDMDSVIIYQAITQAEIDAGTSTTTRLVTPKLLCDNFDKVTTLVEVSTTGDVTQALDSGKFYKFGEVGSLTLTFNAPQAGMGIYGGKFTASASWSTLGIPASVDEAAGNDTVAGGKTYEFNVLDNVIVVKEV